ncbi:DUF2188 domain-containing protein, partial [Microbacterium sp.]|uniref:DUF2188 domain-containing protein n=1 Tax=Microbacterium sp. TaxID=51671 RepID=UPI0028A6B64E
MAITAVVTRSKNGQWVNEVDGAPELSRSYTSRDEAIKEGEALAAEHGCISEIRSQSSASFMKWV